MYGTSIEFDIMTAQRFPGYGVDLVDLGVDICRDLELAAEAPRYKVPGRP